MWRTVVAFAGEVLGKGMSEREMEKEGVGGNIRVVITIGFEVFTATGKCVEVS